MFTFPQTLNFISIYAKIAPIDHCLLPDNILSDADLPLSVLTSNPADEFDFTSSLVLLSEAKKRDMTSRFRHDADACYDEAKQSSVANISGIRYLMYRVLLATGLFNPRHLVLFHSVLLFVLFGAA
jgi:hypothetical protein